jgi:hypothetical protein
MTPATARQWVSVFKDVAIILVAAFLAIHETISMGEPNIYVLGLAGTLFGVPAVMNLDALYRKRADEGRD